MKIPKTVQELESLIRKHNHLYWDKNTPQISDQEYDQLVEALKKLSPKSKLLQKAVGDTISNYGKPVKHATPMLSMNKAYSLEEIEKWAKSIGCKEFVASPKLDGTACSIVYQDGVLVEASTRGNGEVGEDVTENIKRVANVPHRIPFDDRIQLQGRIEVRGEVIMPNSVFERYKDTNSNARNLAAGSLKQKNPDETEKRDLLFYAYGILGTGINAKKEKDKYSTLRNLGFRHVEAWYCPLDKVNEAYDYFINNRTGNDFDIDGVIFMANDIDLQESLGVTGHHPRYAIAWKIAGEMGTTRLTGIEWSISRTGVVTPVGLVDSVNLSGANVNRVSLHNLRFIRDLNLSIGATVEMSRRGMVIPQIERVISAGSEDVVIPDTVDGHETFIDGDFLRLKNPNDSKDVTVGKIIHFVTVLDIDGLGDKIVSSLHEKGHLNTFEDVFLLTMDKLMSIDRMGDKLATKILENVEKKKEMPLNIFLQSLGIDSLGKTVSRILSKKFKTLDAILSLRESDLSSIDGIGDIIAREVVQGLADNSDMIKSLFDSGVSISKTEVKTGKFQGMTFVFTGTLNKMGRKEAQAKVLELGGECPSGVNKDLTYLVIGADAGSKAESAKKLIAKGSKLQIISEDDFVEMVAK